jgi:hypothetical protein
MAGAGGEFSRTAVHLSLGLNRGAGCQLFGQLGHGGHQVAISLLV